MSTVVIRIKSVGPQGPPGAQVLTTKGDILSHTTEDARLPVGVDGQTLTSDSSESIGVKWTTPSGSGDMLASVYDPTSVTGDAFTMDNMVEGATTKVLTATERTKLGGIESLADVTDTTNVTAAGALMDSEIDANLKTFVLPANTTISAFGKTLVDDADDATARTTLGAIGASGSTLIQYNETIFNDAATGATVTIDLADGPVQRFTLDESCTFTLPTIPTTTGETASFVAIIEPATFVPTIGLSSPPGQWMTSDGLVPTFNLSAGKVNVITGIADTYEGTDRWLLFDGGQEA